MAVLALALLSERNCKTCTAAQKAQWGCTEDAVIPMRMDGEDYYRCPRRPFLDQPELVNSVLSAYQSYIKGYLPDPGSLEDQGYRYVVSMFLVDAAVNEAKEELDRRARSKG